MMRRLLLAMSLTFLSLTAPTAQALDTEAIYLGSPFLEGWVPDGVDTLRGCIVIDGWPMDGRWEEAAAFWHFAILRINSDGYEEQLDKDNPDHQILIKERLSRAKAVAYGLRTLGERTGHPELRHVPLVTSGYSRYSGPAQKYVEHFKGRVICFITGFGPSGAETPSKHTHSWLETPSQWLGCEWENIYNPGDKKTLLKQWQRAPGVLRMASMTWRVYHAPQNYSDLAFVFVDQCIKARVPADWDPRSGPATLRPVKEADGWVGDHAKWAIEVDDIPKTNNENAAIMPIAEFQGDRHQSWILNETVAWNWRAMNSRKPAVRIIAPGFSGVVIHEASKTIPPVLHSEAGVRAGRPFTVQVRADAEDISKLELFANTLALGEAAPFTGGEVALGSSKAGVSSTTVTIPERGCYGLMAKYTRADGSVGWSRPVPLFVWGAED